MRLGSKIFAASAGALLVLSALTLAIVSSRVSKAEELRIRAALLADFRDLERELTSASERTGLIIEPQVYEMRARLADPKDNYVTFANDFRSQLAGTRGHTPRVAAVLISGADGQVLGLSQEPEVVPLGIAPERFAAIARVLDAGAKIEYVGVIGGRAFHVTHLPLKSQDRQDFAEACITVLAAIDRDWLTRVRPPARGEGLVLSAGGRVLERTLSEDAAADAIIAAATCLGEAQVNTGSERYLAWVHEFPSPATPSARLVLARSLDAALEPLRSLQKDLAVAAAGVLLAALLAVALFSRRIARPLAALSRATQRVADGELDFKVGAASRNDEIGELARAFDGMLEGLRDRQRIKETFGKYVAPAIVEDLLKNPQALALGGDRRELTVYFSDIKGFTSLSEAMGPEELVRFLNRYLTEMTQSITAAGGIVDKYIGDAVVAFWTRPFHTGNHAVAACKAALENQRAVKALRETFDRDDLRRLEIRIGLSSGEAVVGNIGSNQIRGYTAIGDVVNLGARLEGANKSYGTGILISEAVRLAAGAEIVTCELDMIRVVGKKQPVRVYELVGIAGAVDQEELDAIARFERALARYRARAFEEALALLAPAGGGADETPLPGAPDTTRRRTRRAREGALVTRCRGFLSSPPAEGWDGVYDSVSK